MLEEELNSLRYAMHQRVKQERLDAVLSTLVIQDSIACYSNIAPIVGLHHRSPDLGVRLGKIMESDHEGRIPLRCSVVVSKAAGMPGASYFEKARSLGYEIPATPHGELWFWVDQLHKLNMTPPQWAVDQLAAAELHRIAGNQ